MSDDTKQAPKHLSTTEFVSAFARRYGTAELPALDSAVERYDRYTTAMQDAHHARRAWHQALERACAEQPALAAARATLEAAERTQHEAHEALLSAILDTIAAVAQERAS